MKVKIEEYLKVLNFLRLRSTGLTLGNAQEEYPGQKDDFNSKHKEMNIFLDSCEQEIELSPDIEKIFQFGLKRMTEVFSKSSGQ